MDHMGWQKAYVAGASMAARLQSLRHTDSNSESALPHRTQGLGLFDTTEWYGETAPKDWRSGRKAADEGLASLTAFQKTRWFSDAFANNTQTLYKPVSTFS